MWIPVIGCIIYFFIIEHLKAQNKERSRIADKKRRQQAIEQREFQKKRAIQMDKYLAVVSCEDSIEVVINTDVVPVTPEEDIVMKNIGCKDNPLIWWPCSRKDLPGPSVAEQKIIDILNMYKVMWYREVSFSGLRVNTYSYPRYDIMLLIDNVPAGIVILEYDGVQAHSTPEQKAMDKLKTKFCKDNHVPLYRYNRTHYYQMRSHIDTLMKEYNIQPKRGYVPTV